MKQLCALQLLAEVPALSALRPRQTCLLCRRLTRAPPIWALLLYHDFRQTQYQRDQDRVITNEQ